MGLNSSKLKANLAQIKEKLIGTLDTVNYNSNSIIVYLTHEVFLIKQTSLAWEVELGMVTIDKV